MHSEQRRVDDAHLVQTIKRPFSRSFNRSVNFCKRFVEVNLDSDVQLVCEHPQFNEGFIRQSVGRVRRVAGRYQRMIDVGIVNQVVGLVHVLGRIACPGRRELDDRRADHCSHLQVYGGFSDDFREEILIAEAGLATGDHLRYG